MPCLESLLVLIPCGFLVTQPCQSFFTTCTQWQAIWRTPVCGSEEFYRESFQQHLRQAHQDGFGMLEISTIVEFVILRMKSALYQDWTEGRTILIQGIRHGYVKFRDLRAEVSDLIELWTSIRPYIRNTGLPHVKETFDGVNDVTQINRGLFYPLYLWFCCWCFSCRGGFVHFCAEHPRLSFGTAGSYARYVYVICTFPLLAWGLWFPVITICCFSS